MSGFTERYYTSHDGLKLYARDYAGPANPRLTVVCIPGLTRNTRDFEAVAEHLSATYRVICVDLRGRGKSEYARDAMTYQPPTYVRDMLAMMKQFELKRVALLGTSLGGLISVLLGAIVPARVLGIVLNDIGPDVDQTGLARIAAYVARGFSGPSWQAAADALKGLDGKLYPDYRPEDWLTMARRRFKEQADGTVHQDYDLGIAKPFGDASQAASAAASLWPFFGRLRHIPVLAIRGAISDVLAPETFAKMKQLLPHMQQVSVPDRGHTPYLDEQVARAAIDAFLAGLPAKLPARAVARRTLGQIAFLLKLRLGRIPGVKTA